MTRLRMHPPVVSPVSASGFVAAVRAGLGDGDDASRRLEHALAERFAADAVVLTDSGTSALVLALRLTAGRGAVALPGFACIDLSAACELVGTSARLYDVDRCTLSPDLDSLRGALRRGVQAVVVAHFFGYPTDVSGVVALADEFGVPVIEDAAQSAGGRIHGRPIGSDGDYSVLSFGRGKGTTGGGGGALLLRGPAAARVREIGALPRGARAQGWKRLGVVAAQWALGRPSLYRLPSSLPQLRLGQMVYHAAEEPNGLPATSAALALDSLGRVDGEAAARSDVARRLLEFVPPSGVVRPIDGARPGYLRLPVRAPGAEPAPELGVLRAYPQTLDQHTPLAPLLLAGERAGPGSVALRDTLYTLPTHHFVGSRDVAHLAAWLRAHPPNARAQ